MPSSPRELNPIFARMNQDNVFTGGVNSDMRNSMSSTFGNMRRTPTYQTAVQPEMPNAAPTAAGGIFGGGMDAPGSRNSPAAFNLASGNPFGGGMVGSERASFLNQPSAVQLAGVLSGTEDQGKVAMFQSALSRSGFNLDPVGQLPEEYQGALAGAKTLYNNIFGGGLPPGAAAAPVAYHTYAPDPAASGSAALTAPRGAPITGFGGTQITGTPGAMYDGADGRQLPQYQQRGNHFTLTQNPNTVPGAPGYTPAAPSVSPPSRSGAASNAYDRNVATFKQAQIEDHLRSGLLKSIPPGYMIDPANPGAIKPIPGGPAEVKLAEDKQAAADAVSAKNEKVRQTTETANTVVSTIDKILPQIDKLTAGPVGGIAQHLPGTSGYNVGALIKSVKSNLGVSQLQQMREASKTGASGFGNLSDKELDVLTSTIANLDQAQSPDQLKEALGKVSDHFNAWKLSYDAGQKAAAGTLSPQDQAKALLAIRNASKAKK